VGCGEPAEESPAERKRGRQVYDPLGRRVEKVAGGVTTSYTYDGVNILREITGATTPKYVQGPGIDELLAQEDGAGVLSYFHADGLGSIVKTTNSAGAVTASRRYDAFGNLELATTNGYAFTGREWDSETGLYYYRARYYDPKIGRFLSEDPIGFEAGVNFYSYVQNGPVNLTDPFGLDSFACSVPLGNLPPWTRHLPFLHHDYLCVTGLDGRTICGGMQPAVPVSGLGPVPGAPSVDSFNPPTGTCKPLTKAPESCFEKCVQSKIGPNAPRPPYALGPDGITCQGFVNQTMFGCMTECLILGGHFKTGH
jgi:RHS repeat-associated protein